RWGDTLASYHLHGTRKTARETRTLTWLNALLLVPSLSSPGKGHLPLTVLWATVLSLAYLSCLSEMLWGKPSSMAQARIHMWGNRQLPGTFNRRRELSGSPFLFALLIFAAFVCGSCQSPLPPLPNPPGPHTAVRLSPGD